MAGDSYKPRLLWMLVVAVTATGADGQPAVLLDELDDVADFHTWQISDAPVQGYACEMAQLSGKDADGEPLSGHAHPVYFLHFDGDQASRLCVWREQPFTDEEQAAILKAAEEPIVLTYKKSSWTANLIPLDRLVPLPPSAGSHPASVWESSTP